MLDSSNPGRSLAGVPISLPNREFQFQFAMKSDLELSVEVDHGNPAYLRISSPLTKANLIPSRAKRPAN